MGVVVSFLFDVKVDAPVRRVYVWDVGKASGGGIVYALVCIAPKGINLKDHNVCKHTPLRRCIPQAEGNEEVLRIR